MPKLTLDYSNACIYKICHEDEILYIGSTANYGQRKSNHKSSFNKGCEKCHLYIAMRELGMDWESIHMSVLESYPILEGTPLEMKRQLERRERELILEHNPPYNKENPAPNTKEKKERNKLFVRKNRLREEVKQKDLDYAKKYREEHKDDEEWLKRQKEGVRKSHEKYGDKYKERQRERVTCPRCNSTFNRSSTWKHNKGCKTNIDVT